MFILELYDRKGKKLNLGDIVKISDGRWIEFYCEVKYLGKERVITPFHTFSFSSVEKVDKVPEGAYQCDEERYKIWHVERKEDATRKEFENYLMDWRQCEYLLEKGHWRIAMIPEKKQHQLF